MKRKFAPVMITAAALITTVPTTQVFASEGINAETAADNITPLVINTDQEAQENVQEVSEQTETETTVNAQDAQSVDNEKKTIDTPTASGEPKSVEAETATVKADVHTDEVSKPATQEAGQKLSAPENIKWDGKVLSWDAVKGSNELTLSDGTAFPVQVRYQITVKSTDGEEELYAFGDTEDTRYDFSDALENDIPANAKFCFVVSAYYDSEDIPNGSVDQMNEAYEVMENLAADETTTGEYQNNSSSKPDTPKSEEISAAAVVGAIVTAAKDKNPEYSATTDTKGTEIVRESWTCEEDGTVNSSDSADKLTFEAGKTYSYSVTLAAKEGYHFGDGFTATVNGKAATVVHNADGTITLKDISTVAVPADTVVSKKIDIVKAENATLTAKAGERPKFTAKVPEGEDRYEIAYEAWTDGVTTVRSDSKDSDFVFEAGKTYKYSIAFRLTEKGAAEGYHMNGSALSLNGENSGVSISETGTTAEYVNAASVDIPKEDSKPDTGKDDSDKKEDSKPDTGKDDSDKKEDSEPDTGKDDSDKKEDSKPDTGKDDSDKKEDSKPDTGKKDDLQKNDKNDSSSNVNSGQNQSTSDKVSSKSNNNDGQNTSGETGNGNSVKTGDPAVWGLWASLFGSSGIAGAVIRRRKRK